MKTFILLILATICQISIFPQTGQKITVGVPQDNPTLAFTDSNSGELDGFCIELTKTLMKELNLYPEFKKLGYGDWLQSIDTCNVDLLSSAIYSKEKSDKYYQSIPYSKQYYLVICRDNESYDGIKSILGKRVAVKNGGYPHALLITLGKEYYENAIIVDEIKTGLQMLKDGECDVFIIDNNRARNIIIKNKLKGLDFYDIGIPPQELCYASKDRYLIRSINKALYTTMENGVHNKLYLKWFGAKDEKSESIIIYYLLGGLVIFSLITTLSIIFLRRRTNKAETNILKSTDMITNLNQVIDMLLNDEKEITVMLYDTKKDMTYKLINKEFKNINTTLRDKISLVHPEDKERFVKACNAILLENKDKVSTSARMFEKRLNKYVDYIYTATAQRDKDGNLSKVLFYRRDDSNHQQTVRNQDETITSLNLALRSAKLLRWKFVLGSNTHTIIDSEGNEEIFLNNNWKNIILKNDHNNLKKYLQSLLRGEKTQNYIVINAKFRESEDYKQYEFSAIVQHNKAGEVVSMYGLLNNVSIIYSYQRQLNEKIKLLETMNNNMPLGIAYIDKEGVIRELNKFHNKLFGVVNHNNVIGINILQESTLLSHENKVSLLNREIVHRQIYFEQIPEIIKKNIDFSLPHGEVFDFSCVAIFNDDKELTGYLLLFKDITESYRDKENIRLSEERLGTILDTLPIPLYIIDPENKKFIYANKKTYSMMNIEANCLFYNFLEKKTIEAQTVIDAHVIQTGKDYVANEIIYLKNGEKINTYVIKKFMEHNGQKQILVVRMDLTKQLKTQLANKILSNSLPFLNAYTWYIDSRESIVHYGDTFFNTERDIREYNTFEKFISIVHTNDRKINTMVFKDLAKQIKREALFVYRTDIEKIGVYQWWETRAVIETIGEGDGSYDFIYGISININSRKENELRLEENKAMLINLNKQNEIVLNSISSVLVFINTEYTVQWTNSHNIIRENGNLMYVKGEKCYKSFGYNSPCYNCYAKKAMETGVESKIEFNKIPGCIFEATAIPIEGSNGIEGVVIKLDDVTERKQLIADLSSSNQIMSTILDESPTSLFIKDVNDDFRYVFVSRHFCKTFVNKTHEQIIGFTDYDIFEEKHVADKFRADDLDIVNTSEGLVINIGEERILNNGIEVIVETKKLVLKLPNDKIYLIGQASDITELRRMNESLIAAKEKAEESEKLKMAFLANMSHEIRTPLNAIVGFSELLQDEENEEEKREYSKIINKNNELLLRLINDILDLSKIESGIIEMKPSTFDAIDLFNEEFFAFKNSLNKPNIEVIAHYSMDKCVITIDSNRLVQIIKNFLSNAAKYTISGTIEAGINYIDGGLKVYVKDTGIGIDEDKQHLLFHRFEKLDTFAQGTGLGLAICKAIIDTLGGKIGVESKKGVGSTFWAWLPCEKKIEEKKHKHSPRVTNEINTNEKLNILIAEDIDSNYMLVKEFLRGHKLTRAKNGKEAVDLCKSNEFDIIFMDIRMPVMDGIEATTEIRKFNDYTSIVALTANAFESDKQAVLNVGFDDFISKPVSKSTIINILAMWGKNIH